LESARVPPFTAGHALPAEFPCSPTDCSLAWRALGCYTCLRTLSRRLALSPFPPLALLRGLCAPQRSALIDEVHVRLLRLLARRYKPPKLPTASAKCQPWGLLDRTNWPVYFGWYVQARQELTWAAWEDANVLWGGWDEETERRGLALAQELAVTEWQRTEVATRVGVLEYLCGRLMDLPEVVEELGARGAAYDMHAVQRTEHPDAHTAFCGVCRAGGDLLLCDACPSVYHYACVGEKPHSLPAVWLCPECRFPDPAYYAARVPEHYCRVALRSQTGKEESWVLRVVHGFVFRQVVGGSGDGPEPGAPQLLTPAQVYRLLKQLGPERANRWPFSQLRRPLGLFAEREVEVGQQEVTSLSLRRELLRREGEFWDPSVPEYALATILDAPLGRPLRGKPPKPPEPVSYAEYVARRREGEPSRGCKGRQPKPNVDAAAAAGEGTTGTKGRGQGAGDSATAAESVRPRSRRTIRNPLRDRGGSEDKAEDEELREEEREQCVALSEVEEGVPVQEREAQGQAAEADVDEAPLVVLMVEQQLQEAEEEAAAVECTAAGAVVEAGDGHGGGETAAAAEPETRGSNSEAAPVQETRCAVGAASLEGLASSRPRRQIRKPAIYRDDEEEEEKEEEEKEEGRSRRQGQKGVERRGPRVKPLVLVPSAVAAAKEEEQVEGAATTVTSRGRVIRRPASYNDSSDGETAPGDGGGRRRGRTRKKKAGASSSITKAKGKGGRKQGRRKRRQALPSSSSEEEEEDYGESEPEFVEWGSETEDGGQQSAVSDSDFVVGGSEEGDGGASSAEEEWVVKASGPRSPPEEEDEEAHGGLVDDPDAHVAAAAPHIHQLLLRARVQLEGDAGFFNPFLYSSKYRFNAPDAARACVLELVRGSWRPRFAAALRPALDLDDVSIRARIEAAAKPLPQVAHLPPFDDRGAYAHLEKAKDQLLQVESRLRGLLVGPWEAGTAVVNAWGERVYMSRSVRELGRLTALMVESAHPRAFLAGWHSVRAGGFSREPTQLDRAPLREPGPLIGATSRVPPLKRPHAVADTRAARGLPVRERRQLEEKKTRARGLQQPATPRQPMGA
jgi:hypothetical protein